MRSRVEIVADVADDGRPVLVRAVAEGQFGVRATGPGQVHLVGTAAGPLGGDEARVHVRVRAGATLAVHGVAATLALPGRDPSWSRLETVLEVEDGGRLRHLPSPLVVCRGARLRTLTVVSLAGRAGADVAEHVVLGRHGEVGGEWTGRLVATRDGRALVRTTQSSALVLGTVPPGSEAGTPPARVVVSRLVAGTPFAVPAAARGGAVCCPLATGTDALVTALAADLSTAVAQARSVLAAGAAPAAAAVPA